MINYSLNFSCLYFALLVRGYKEGANNEQGSLIAKVETTESFYDNPRVRSVSEGQDSIPSSKRPEEYRSVYPRYFSTKSLSSANSSAPSAYGTKRIRSSQSTRTLLNC